MAIKIRKQIYLDQRQNLRLKRLAEARGVSEAEVIRGLIDAQAGGTVTPALPPDPAAWEAILHFIRQRAKSGATGMPYQWSRQELYEERERRFGHRVNDAEAGQPSPAAAPNPPAPSRKSRRPKTPRRSVTKD